MDQNNFVAYYLWSSKRYFKPYQKEHDLVKEAGVKGTKHVILNQKSSDKNLVALPT